MTRSSGSHDFPSGDVLTIAVEEYFQVTAFRKLIHTDNWYRFERRIEQNTNRTLDLLDESDTRATFFALGWVADEMPEVIRSIAERGHEVAIKGYYHRSIDEMSPGEFREDLQRAREAVERATGTRVWGHRLAEGHLGVEHLWALDILADEGFAYDSSVYPRLRSTASEPWRRFAHIHRWGERELRELPLATWDVAGWLLPIAGGNYLRQLPHGLMHRLVQAWHQRYSQPFVMYFHIWELDTEQPRIAAAGPWTRIRQYRNLGRMPALLRSYLSTYDFRPAHEYLGLDLEPAEDKIRREASSAISEPVRVSPPVMPVTIVVPCYNEEKVLPYLENTLRRVVDQLGEEYDFQFVFVDDGSDDDTWALVQTVFAAFPKCRFVRHEENKGVAAAILTGVRNAETEIVCSIDCDCTYDPQQLENLIPVLADDVAVVTASPYHPDGLVVNVPGWRLALSKGLSALYRRAFRVKLWTYTSCFRVYRRSAILDLPLKEHGFLGVAEILAILDQRGAKIVERPAVLEVRMLGRSKMKLIPTIFGHLRLLIRVIWARWFDTFPAS